jgi:hypothetical protein
MSKWAGEQKHHVQWEVHSHLDSDKMRIPGSRENSVFFIMSQNCTNHNFGNTYGIYEIWYLCCLFFFV